MILVLASASHNRLELLRNIALEPDIIAPADIDEIPLKGELPKDFVARMAEEKALTVREKHGDAFIIAADTVASCGRRIIGKAENEIEARKTLKLLSGRRHRIYTGLCIIAPDGAKRIRKVMTSVKFKRLHESELKVYLESREWEGKSGCYAIQKRAGGFIESINGSFSNVVGLPLVETRNILTGLGYKID